MPSKQRQMTVGEARSWLGIYFLFVTVGIGAFLILFGGERSFLLPIAAADASAAFEIIVPVLVGQVTLVFQFYAVDEWQSSELRQPARVPAWIVKAPPLLVLGMFVLGVVLLAAGNKGGWGPDANQFRHLVTFCVTILNASAVFLVGRFFKRASKAAADEGAPRGP